MKNSLKLKDVSFALDPATASIILKSDDKNLKGKPFKLTLNSNSESYKTLFSLLESEGLASLDPSLLATSIRIDDASATDVQGSDPRSSLYVGETFYNKPMALELTHFPHTLIVGSAGSGKSVITRTIITHALAHDEIEIRGIDLKAVELTNHSYRDCDVIATTLDETVKLVDDLLIETKRRFAILEQQKLTDYLKTELPAIYFIVDEYAILLHTPEASDVDNAIELEIKQKIQELAGLGRAAGVYLFISTQRPDHSVIEPGLRYLLDNHILMGLSTPMTERLALNAKAYFGEVLRRNRGRGIISRAGQQEIFQAYFLPYGKLKH